MVEGALPPSQRFQQPSRLSAAAAAEFGDDYGTRHTIDDVLSVSAQQAIVRAGKAIFGKMADDLEQRRADVVVQIFRGQFLLPRLGQAGPDFFSKFIRRIRSNRADEHSFAP